MSGRVAASSRAAASNRWPGFDAAFDPASVFDLWSLDPSNSVLNGGNVASCPDGTANARNVSQSTAGNQPAYNASNASFNGHATWDWPNGAASSLDTATFAGLNAPLTFLMVAKVADVTTRQLLDVVSGNSVSIRSVIGVSMLIGTGGDTPFPGNMLQPSIILASYDVGNVCSAWINGVFFGRKVVTSPSNVVNFRIGNSTAATLVWSGSIADVRLASKVLSTAERRNAFRYFGDRYGIAVALS